MVEPRGKVVGARLEQHVTGMNQRSHVETPQAAPDSGANNTFEGAPTAAFAGLAIDPTRRTTHCFDKSPPTGENPKQVILHWGQSASFHCALTYISAFASYLWREGRIGLGDVDVTRDGRREECATQLSSTP